MLLVLIALGFVLLAALVTLPTAKSAGPGRIAAFVVLALVGAVGALLIDHSDLLPGRGLDTVKAEKARDLMIADLEAQAQVKVVKAPSVEAIAEADSPTVWRMERGLSVLCTATDFPESAEMVCFTPAVMVAEGVMTDAAPDVEDTEPEVEPTPEVVPEVEPEVEPDTEPAPEPGTDSEG